MRAEAFNLQTGMGVRFVLDTGTASEQILDDYSVPFEIWLSNVAKAEHTIDVYIIDDTGTPVQGTFSHDSLINVGIGDYYVAFGDSITFGYGDDLTTDDISNDGRNSEGGYEPVLNNLLTAFYGYPHTIVNEGVPGYTSADGAAMINDVISRHPESQYFLIMLGTNTGGALPIPSGLGLNPGDAGYSGSYKDHMQQIIDAVISAGKTPYLAKVPYALGAYSSRNALYQEYNAVIDELVTANGITVVPPDFYTYFMNHQTEYSDDLHPNGTGYQSMANLWYQALTQ